jgi:hypothetical protein
MPPQPLPSIGRKIRAARSPAVPAARRAAMAEPCGLRQSRNGEWRTMTGGDWVLADQRRSGAMSIGLLIGDKMKVQI